ncbi:MAG TPA: hypothetical protein VF240_04805 [Pyrinomonadaceae bacterium]
MKFKTSLTSGAVALILLLTATMFVAEALPQQRGRRPSRRATAPARARGDVLPAPTPLPAEPSVISTAEDVAAQDDDTPPRRRNSRTTRRAAAQEADEQQRREEEMRNSVNRLTQTVTRLSDELTAMKGEQRVLVDLERLTRAEQRAESLRSQLRDVTDKEFVLQDRLAQITAELDPGAIERRSLLIGSLNPANVREQIRLSLEREKERVSRQLELLNTSRVRLESAVAAAEQDAERIKARIDAIEQQQTDANAAGNQTTITQPAPTPTPTSNPPAEPPQE